MESTREEKGRGAEKKKKKKRSDRTIPMRGMRPEHAAMDSVWGQEEN
jgi:hypothetical protein